MARQPRTPETRAAGRARGSVKRALRKQAAGILGYSHLQTLFALAARRLGVAFTGRKGEGYRILAQFVDAAPETLVVLDSKQPSSTAPAAQRFSCSVDPVSDAFLDTYAWRRLRMRVLRACGARCQCCGATAKDGVRIHVDHIKPRRKYPELALEESNLQVLCEVCNHGKGNWDETDWREQAFSNRPQVVAADVTDPPANDDPVIAGAPRCTRCRRKSVSARWRMYSNGDVHLVWWCCGRQVSGSCLPPRYADRFGAGDRPSLRPIFGTVQ